MKEATSQQIPNTLKRVGRSFPGYGFQTWIRNRSYWWVGFGGQRVGIEPETEKVIVVTSWREDYMDKIYRLFDDWVADR
jgi:CubicO group peptidase (beta-lactamase class C family)